MFKPPTPWQPSAFVPVSVPQNCPMLHFASRECCLPGPHNSEDMCGLVVQRVSTSRKPHDGGILVPGDRFFTWVPSGGVFVTLMKLDNGATVVYDHRHDRLFFASPRAILGPAIPAGTALLAIYSEDGVGTLHAVPWLLVFDVLAMGWKRMDGIPASQRYDILRGPLKALCVTEDHGVGKSLLRLHWVGKFICAPHILDGSMKLPHSVESFVLLRDSSPVVVDILGVGDVP